MRVSDADVRGLARSTSAPVPASRRPSTCAPTTSARSQRATTAGRPASTSSSRDGPSRSPMTRCCARLPRCGRRSTTATGSTTCATAPSTTNRASPYVFEVRPRKVLSFASATVGARSTSQVAGVGSTPRYRARPWDHRSPLRSRRPGRMWRSAGPTSIKWPPTHQVEGRDDEHDPDGATAAFEHALAVGLLAAAEERLAALEQAAARAEVGTYGTCERCGRPIDLERLAARPEAATCAACSPSRRGLSWSS